MKITRPTQIKTLAIAFILTSTVFSVFGQLSGNKVIGTSPSDYQTFTAAVNALNTQGISASVTFNVKPGTYNEQITINQITGASATKTITFQAQNLDSTSVTLTFASSGTATNNFVIYLNGADYVSFKYMTIERSGILSYGQLIEMSNGAIKNAFRSCILRGTNTTATTTFASIAGSTNAAYDSCNTFYNNKFIGGSYGLNFIGMGNTMLDRGLVVSNNVFTNQSSKGIYISYQDSPQITNNVITSTSTINNYNAIYALYANNGARFTKNKIAIKNGSGLYLSNCETSGAKAILIANNFISDSSANASNAGIYMSLVKYANIYYNNVNMWAASTSRDLYVGGLTTQNLEIKNNIFMNGGGGNAIYVDANTGTTPITVCNYNDLYTTGTNIGFWKSTGNVTSLANWTTASTFDANSITLNPQYVSNSDLHVNNGNLNEKATATLSLLTPVTDDIDNQVRNVTTPDIGADEFYVEDLGVSSVHPASAACQFTNTSINVRIKNYSSWPFNGTTPVHYKIPGGSTINEVTGNLSIPAGDSVLYTFSTPAYFSNAGLVAVISGTGLSYDVNHNNDSLASASINVLPAPVVGLGSDVYVCLGQSVTLTANSAASYEWNTVPPQFTQSINILVTDTTEVIVSITAANTCMATDTVMVIPGNFPKPVADFTWAENNLQVYFTDQSSDATSWNWDFGDGNHSTQASPMHTYTTSGSYNAVLIAINACDSDTTSQLISATGMNELNSETLIGILPNPASETFTINAPAGLQIDEILIYNLQSVIVRRYALPSSRTFDINDLTEGMYFLVITSGNGRSIKKLVVQR